ncbi:MAG: N-acetylmuramoyl-L-alanine amidase, partial [Clostridiales bacterium]|nr:N-acetylmuramoyl-L-alanine amidase [Clostridiales bacterium]
SEATGANYRGHDASSRYSGLNWATDIPSFLLEMGYMTNREEDLLLSDPDYQLKICAGIADFVSRMPLNPDRPKDLD